MPGLRLDFLMASIINCKASSFEFRDGAKPPSSPTADEYFLDIRILLRL